MVLPYVVEKRVIVRLRRNEPHGILLADYTSRNRKEFNRGMRTMVRKLL